MTRFDPYPPPYHDSEEIGYPNFRHWIRAASFHGRHWQDLVVVFPLLFIPVLSDSLHAILIRQERSEVGRIRTVEALKESVHDFPDLLVLKFQFWLAASLWSLVPIIGWFKDYEHRINWSMASNVVAFEGLIGRIARKRCIELARSANPYAAARTLITVPSLIIVLCSMLIGFGQLLLETSLFLWISGFLILWTVIPWSAAVNTCFYLTLQPASQDVEQHSLSKPAIRTHAQYCPRCLNYDQSRGLCSRLHFSVINYPRQFRTDCNATFFQKVQILPSSLTCPSCQAILELEQSERVAFVFTCPNCRCCTDWTTDESDLVGTRSKTMND